MSAISKPHAALAGSDEFMSPFVNYDDGYHWPDLYTELDECLEAVVLVYPIAELRKSARKNGMDDDDPVFRLPLTHVDAIEVIRERRQSSLNPAPLKRALEACAQRDMLPKAENRGGLVHVTPTSIIAFEDNFSQPDLAYMIDGNVLASRVLKSAKFDCLTSCLSLKSSQPRTPQNYDLLSWFGHRMDKRSSRMDERG